MTILEAIGKKTLFARWFGGKTWSRWLTFLRVLFGLSLSSADVEIFRQHTQRSSSPTSAFRESWVVVGRRGGKSLIAALVAVFIACFRSYSAYLQPGEFGTVAVIAADRRQTRTIIRYIRAFLALPMLRKMVANDTAESIELTNRIVIEVHSASWRSVRGYTIVACICDEIAFWRSDDSANPDKEIIAAVRPGLATIPNSLLLCVSSPYARRGSLWQAYQKHFGKDSPVLVWQATSQEMNPSLSQSVVDRAIEEDEPAARAEYFAEFRKDVESFVAREAIEACRILDRYELPPIAGVRYIGFVDPSGGSSDSMTLAIAHREKDSAVLDCVREVKPPFSPDSVVREFAELLESYRITTVVGDRYAGEWPRERFRVHGIRYEPAAKTKNEIYLAFLPMLNAGRCELLDHPKLASQLQNLERRTARGGKDSVDHPPHSHDDVANAAAGVLTLAVPEGKKVARIGRLMGRIRSMSPDRLPGAIVRDLALADRLAVAELQQREARSLPPLIPAMPDNATGLTLDELEGHIRKLDRAIADLFPRATTTEVHAAIAEGTTRKRELERLRTRKHYEGISA